MSEYRELLLGCGSSRNKQLLIKGEVPEWRNLTTLDIDPDHKPDVEWDLSRRLPLPFDDNSFDEIHAYEVLEHIANQGDYVRFFEQFEDYWRILKPDGTFRASCPSLTSRWLWGDPGHTRVIAPESLVFLDQAQYTEQVGKTQMTDYRHWYRADFNREYLSHQGESFYFMLRAVKPSRLKYA